MGKGLGPIIEKLKHMNKDHLLIALLAGVLLLVIAIPTQDKNSTPSVPTTENTSGLTNTTKKVDLDVLQGRLVQTLSKVEGVGKVEVMLTQKSSKEKIVEKDSPVTDKNTEEKDSEGGIRSTMENVTGEETVYEKDENGNQVPYVVKELEPEIAGVLIVAEGGGDPVTVNNITEAVMSLFDIDAHKIKVMKMN